MHALTKLTGPGAATLLFAVFATPPSAFADDCNAALLDTVCECNLAKLQPLQGAVGLKEVEHKEDGISRHEDEERDRLRDDPIKVVAGPGGQLYITDHHHGALAWWTLRAKTKWGAKSLCKVQALRDEDGRPQSFKTEDDFWAALKAAHLIRLKDESGNAVANPKKLQTLEELAQHDDPYRSLAWKVRDKGFCRPAGSKEFLEFFWADFFRSHQDKLPIKEVRNLSSKKSDDAGLVNAASELAQDSEAKTLVGYKPKGTECPKSD